VAYSQNVHDYLRRQFFKHKDLSAVKNSLDEVFQNIFDHADAKGNAFSFLKFDHDENKLHVAVCDFGIGIAYKVKEVCPEFERDCDAIEKAIQDMFTTRSQTHNMGMGLGNIRMTCTDDDALRIISNNGIFLAKRNLSRKGELGFEFPGTLIYYELSLDHFEDEEFIKTFELELRKENLMCTIHLSEIMKDRSFPASGEMLYNEIERHIDCGKIKLDLTGVTSLPSMFLNVSIGRFFNEYGYEKLANKISFANISKSQADRISDYIDKLRNDCK